MTTTPESQETPMTDLPRDLTPPDVWPHEDLEPGSPAELVYQALAQAHPTPLTTDDLAGGQPELTAGDLDEVRDALAELDAAGIVTPSTREPDAVWMLHGPARRAADEAQPHA